MISRPDEQNQNRPYNVDLNYIEQVRMNVPLSRMSSLKNGGKLEWKIDYEDEYYESGSESKGMPSLSKYGSVHGKGSQKFISMDMNNSLSKRRSSGPQKTKFGGVLSTSKNDFRKASRFKPKNGNLGSVRINENGSKFQSTTEIVRVRGMKRSGSLAPKGRVHFEEAKLDELGFEEIKATGEDGDEYDDEEYEEEKDGELKYDDLSSDFD